MKYIIVFMLTISSFSKVLCQTYIIPFIGLDFSKIQDYDSLSAVETNVTILENGYSSSSPTIGVNFRKGLNKNFLLSLNLEFTHKKVKAYNFRGIATAEAISFNYFRNSASFILKLNTFNVEIGGHYNMLGNVKYVYARNIKSKFVDPIPEKGIRFSILRNIQNFDLMIYFIQGLNSIKSNDDDLHLSKIQSLGLQLRYLFAI